MKLLNLMTKSLLGIMALMLVAGVWVSPAAAQTPERSYDRLEYGLKRAELRLDILEDKIDHTTSAADIVDEYIQDEKDAGQDTSTLEAALADLRAKISEVESAYNTAAQALDDKAGFDENGEVTDPEQARETLETANQALKDGNQALQTGRQDLRQAMRDYRQDKRGNR